MAKMSKRFSRPKKMVTTDPVLRFCFDLVDRAADQVKNQSLSSSPDPIDIMAVHKPALMELSGGRFLEIVHEGCLWTSSKELWKWEDIRYLAALKLESGNTDFNWGALIDDIWTFCDEPDPK